MAQAAAESPATQFGPVKQSEAGRLDAGYVDAGSAGGPAVPLLHGWPHDLYRYADVVPPMTAARLPSDRPARLRLRHDATLVGCHDAQRRPNGRGPDR